MSGVDVALCYCVYLKSEFSNPNINFNSLKIARKYFYLISIDIIFFFTQYLNTHSNINYVAYISHKCYINIKHEIRNNKNIL